ncbi:MAG: sugar ABC transporter substrate-binding protein [bacterium]
MNKILKNAFKTCNVIVLFRVSATLGLLIFSACSPSKDERTEIVFWAMGREGEEVAKLMPEFERLNPGIKVRVQMIPWQAAHEKLLTSYAGTSLPDMCQLGNTWLPEFHLLNAIENLSPYIEQSSTTKPQYFFSGILDTYVMDSAVYGIPWYVDTRLLFYRSDLLAKVGYSNPPRNWSEWFDAADKLSSKGKGPERYGMFLPTNNEFQPPIIMGLEKGSSLLKENNTRGDFSGKEFRSALTAFHRFFANGLAPVKTNQIANVYQPFAEGYFAMFITGPWNIVEFGKRLPPEMQNNWMTAPMPGPDSGIGVSLAGGSGLVMFRSSKHKAEVWKVIEYLSQPEVQLQFYNLTADLPARIESWQDTSLANNRFAHAFLEQLNHVVATPKIPEWEQIAQKVREYAELVSMDKLTVDAATTALDKDVDVMLEKRRWMISH